MESLGLEESPWHSPATPCLSEPPSWDIGRPNDSARLWGPSWRMTDESKHMGIRQGWRAPGRPLSLSSGKQGSRSCFAVTGLKRLYLSSLFQQQKNVEPSVLVSFFHCPLDPFATTLFFDGDHFYIGPSHASISTPAKQIFKTKSVPSKSHIIHCSVITTPGCVFIQ